jgi:hypothetical protein
MALSRRQLLAGLGGGALIAVGGGALFAATRTPTAALAPWREAGLAADPRIRALEWAVLAPNPHNRQPWLVELTGDTGLTLYCDLDRRLPMTDPHDRQITIGLGAFLELLALAAADGGHEAVVTPFPDGAPDAPLRLDGRPVARVAFRPGGVPDPLFAAAPHRRSNKEPYADRPVEPGHLAALGAAVRSTRLDTTVEAAATADWADLCRRAFRVEAATPRTMRESIDLLRIGRAEIEASPDGIDLGGPFVETLSLAGLLTREALADPASASARQTLAMYDALFASARGWVMLTTAGNGRLDQIAAGRDYLRMNLAATAAGLSMHPLSQALQEFPEMAELLAEAQAMAGVAAPGRLQMLARIGYGPATPPSPRWPAASRLIAAPPDAT